MTIDPADPHRVDTAGAPDAAGVPDAGGGAALTDRADGTAGAAAADRIDTAADASAPDTVVAHPSHVRAGRRRSWSKAPWLWSTLVVIALTAVSAVGAAVGVAGIGSQRFVAISFAVGAAFGLAAVSWGAWRLHSAGSSAVMHALIATAAASVVVCAVFGIPAFAQYVDGTTDVTYTVTGTAKDAVVSYADDADGSFGIRVEHQVSLPFTVTLHLDKNDVANNRSLAVGAMNGPKDTGEISCAIAFDGETVVEKSAQGAGVTVSCTR